MGRTNDRITTAMVDELFRRLDIQDGAIVNLIKNVEQLIELVDKLMLLVVKSRSEETKPVELFRYGHHPCKDGIYIPDMPTFLQPNPTFTEPIVTFTEPVVTFTEPEVKSR